MLIAAEGIDGAEFVGHVGGVDPLGLFPDPDREDVWVGQGARDDRDGVALACRDEGDDKAAAADLAAALQSAPGYVEARVAAANVALAQREPQAALALCANDGGTVRESVALLRVRGLAELALLFATENLPPEGVFLVKTFHGAGFDAFFKARQQQFQRVVTRKPEASRSGSRETYLLGRGLKVPV